MSESEEIEGLEYEISSLQRSLDDCYAENEGLQDECETLRGEAEELRDDSELFDSFINHLEGVKWADIFPWWKPEDEKYINPETFKDVLREKIL